MNVPDSDQIEELNRRLKYLALECERLDSRLARVESSIVFRTLRWVGTHADLTRRKIGRLLLHSPLHPLYLRSLRPKAADGYPQWVRWREAQYPSVEWHKKTASSWAQQPKIGIAMPVHNPLRPWLEEAVASVRNQSYENWQLCICDDASTESWVDEWLQSQARADARIAVVRSGVRLGISGALNAATALANAEYLAFLDHDDVLHRFALHYVVECLQAPGADAVYTDEDHLDENGQRTRPHFKPDWSPDLLLSCMYWGHLFTVRRDVLDRCGGFRPICDGSQDHDLALRITDTSAEIRHVPRVLYHWREHAGSTAASSEAKPYTRAAAIRALTDCLERRSIIGQIEDGPFANTYFINRSITVPERVSILICSRNAALLEKCLTAIERTTAYRDCEVVVVRHATGATGDLTRVADAFKCLSLAYDGPFDFARMNSLAAEKAAGSLLVFLNDDVRPLQCAWLDYLVAHLQRPDVGIVGGKLLYPSGAIQHAGMAVGMMDGAGHPGRGMFRSDLFPALELTRDVSAVTGACLGIRKILFQELGGFDPAFPVNYNDVDLCLRVRHRGLRVVFEPRVLMVHNEAATRVGGTSFAERWLYHARWGHLLEPPDPYFPAAFDYGDERIRLKLEP